MNYEIVRHWYITASTTVNGFVEDFIDFLNGISGQCGGCWSDRALIRYERRLIAEMTKDDGRSFTGQLVPFYGQHNQNIAQPQGKG